MTMAKQATKDQIISAIHVLWERGWQVNPRSVQEALKIGQHEECTLERIEAVLPAMEQKGVKEKWLSSFNFDSSFAQQNPRPWPIEGPWQHQHIEQ